MSILDAARRAALVGRKVAANAGVRTTTVSIVDETWSAPVGTYGATMSSSTTTTLSPSPKVNQASDGQGSWFGGGPMTDSAGRPLARTYTIGPITPTCTGGGYSVAQLVPALSSPLHKVYVLLSGDDFQSGGERFEVIGFDASRPLRVMMTVSRTSQGA